MIDYSIDLYNRYFNYTIISTSSHNELKEYIRKFSINKISDNIFRSIHLIKLPRVFERGD